MAKKKNNNDNIVYSAIYSVRSNQWKIQNDQYDLLSSLKLLPESYKDFTFDNLDKETINYYRLEAGSLVNACKAD